MTRPYKIHALSATNHLYRRADSLIVARLAKPRATAAEAVSVCGRNGVKLNCDVTIYHYKSLYLQAFVRRFYRGVMFYIAAPLKS